MTPDFASALEAHGRRTALITAEGRHVSYSELAALADIEAVGFPPERTLVALPIETSLQAVAQYLAALRLGYPVILIDAIDSVAGQRIIEIYRPWLPGTPHPEVIPALHPDLCVMLSTSGTTGSPKLVRLSAANIAANAASIGEYLAITPETRAITTLPLHYSYGLSVLHSHLAAGASLVLTDESVASPAFWGLFEAHSATSLAGVPFTYELFESIGLRNKALPSLKTMTQAGGRLPPALVRTYAEWAQGRGIDFFVMYGQTEATARMAYLPPDKALSHGDCIGIAIPGGAFSLVGEDGATIDGAGRSGELIYSGPNVMMGYAQTTDDLALGAEITALHTGDLAERTPDGLFRIVGRRSRFVKPFGLRVSLDEIEALLGRQGVSAMVAGADDLVAVAFCPAAGASEAGISAQLADLYKLPPTLFDVAAVPELPHLATGKRDYQRILGAARARQTERQAGDADRSFATVYAAILRQPNVEPGASFNSLGGDSLSYVSIVTAIDARIGHIPDGWEDLTIADLDRLAAAQAGGPKGFFKAFDSEIILRALAIIAVVLTHSKTRFLGGGSDALMMLAGFNLARFNFGRLTAGDGWQVLRGFAIRIVLPYYLILIGYALLVRNPGIAAFFLVGNMFEHQRSLLTPFWFIEALTQAMLVMIGLFAIPAVRRMAAAQPWRFGMGLLGVALVVRAVTFTIFHHANLLNTTVEAIFPLFALGWLMFFARDNAAKWLCVGVAVVLAAINIRIFGVEQWFGGWDTEIGLRRAAWIIAVPVLVLFVPRLRLPRPVGQALSAIAAISFTIYLTHPLPAHLVSRTLDLPAIVALVFAIAIGFLTAWVIGRLQALPVVRRWMEGISGRSTGTRGTGEML